MTLYNVSEISVRPERVGQYEEVCFRLAEAAREGETQPWMLFDVASGDFGTYQIVVEHESWAKVGGQVTLDPVIHDLFGEFEISAVERSFRECIASARQIVVRDIPELSVVPEPDDFYPVMEMTRLHARPDRQPQVEELIRRTSEAVIKLEDPRRIIATQTVLGELFEYALMTLVRRLSDLDELPTTPELLKLAYGDAEGALIRERALASIVSADRHVLILREDLSNLPRPGELEIDR